MGHDESSAYGICYAAIVEGKADAMDMASKAGFVLTEQDREQIVSYWSAKYSRGIAVKAVGDWELDVLAVPFGGLDSDKQFFDPMTDIMAENYQTPFIAYQHGIKQGATGLQDKPIKLGDVIPGSLMKQPDGWHVRVILNKAIKQAKDIWEAAKRGLVAVSSGSIAHLSRLDIGGKFIQYEKNRAGRIAVWPLAEISLWDMGNGNVQPANKFAVALPVMKAMYREAGIPFPDNHDTHGATQADSANKRALIAKARRDAQQILQSLKKQEY